MSKDKNRENCILFLIRQTLLKLYLLNPIRRMCRSPNSCSMISMLCRSTDSFSSSSVSRDGHWSYPPGITSIKGSSIDPKIKMPTFDIELKRSRSTISGHILSYSQPENSGIESRLLESSYDFKWWCIFRPTHIRHTLLLTYAKSAILHIRPTSTWYYSCYMDLWPQRPAP